MSIITTPSSDSVKIDQFSSLVTNGFKNEDWDRTFDIIGFVAKDPKAYTDVLFRLCRKHVGKYLSKAFGIPDEEILNMLSIIDAILKNTSTSVVELYKKSALSSDIESLKIVESSAVKARVLQLFEEWEKEVEGWSMNTSDSRSIASSNYSTPSTATHTSITSNDTTSIPSNGSQGKTSINSQPGKILHEMDIVKDNVQLLNDIVSNASNFHEISNSITFQLVANVREMVSRLQQLIESVPEEVVILKALEVHEYAYASLEYYQEYKKTGIRKEVPKFGNEGINEQQVTNSQSSLQLPSIESHANASTMDLLDFNFNIAPGNSKQPTTSNNQVTHEGFYGSSSAPPPFNPVNLENEAIEAKTEETEPPSDPFAAISQRRRKLPPIQGNTTTLSTNSDPNPFQTDSNQSNPNPVNPFE